MKRISHLILASALIITGYALSNVHIKKLDFFNRDVLQLVNTSFNSQISNEITIIDIDSNLNEFSNPIKSTEIEKLALKISEKNPKIILLNIGPSDFANSVDERKLIYDIFKKNQIYLTTANPKDDLTNFNNEPNFISYPYKFNPGFCDDTGFGFTSPRRMFLQFYGEDNDAVQLYDTLHKAGIKTYLPEQFKYSFDRMNTKQLFNKFHLADSFAKLNASEILRSDTPIETIQNKIVVIGRVDEFSFMYAEGLRELFQVPQARSTMANSLIPSHYVLANQINTLLTGDYVKLVSGQYIHHFIIFVLILLIFLKIDSKTKLYLFLAIFPALIVIQTLVYTLTSFYIDLISSYIILVFIQYIGVPIIAFAIFKEQKSKQLEDINNVRIDAFLTLSEKVAHDIRSPLSAINLLINKVSFKSQEQKNIFIQSIKRIELITENLLTKYKTYGITEKSLSIESFLVKELTESIINEKTITNPTIKYSLTSPDKILISSDKLELTRILSNLIDNSIHALANQESPEVKIKIDAQSQTIQIAVTDNGIGIPESLIKILGTERLTTKQNRKGNGIGLLHAKKSIQQMGGKLEIDSEEGQYTKVTLTLPISPQD